MIKAVRRTSRAAVGRTIERVARESYGRRWAYLSVHTHDLASAEDALSEALVSALKAWPREPACRKTPKPGCSQQHAIHSLMLFVTSAWS